METLIQGSKIATSTGNSNNKHHTVVNKTHDYHDEGEDVYIADEDTTK